MLLSKPVNSRHSNTASLMQRISRQRAVTGPAEATDVWRLASEEVGKLYSPYYYSNADLPPDVDAWCVIHRDHTPPVADCSCGVHALRSTALFTDAVWGDVDTEARRGRPYVLIPVTVFAPMPDQDVAHYPDGHKSIRGRSYTLRGPILTANTPSAVRLRRNGYRVSIVQPLSHAVQQIAAGAR